MPYTDDPENVPADQVRFLVGDTDTGSPELTDNQVAYLLSAEGDDPKRAAARAAEALAAKYAKAVDEKEVGPLRIRYSEKAARFTALARQLWSRATVTSGGAPYAGGISADDKATNESDSDRVAPFFYRGLQDYPVSATDEELQP